MIKENADERKNRSVTLQDRLRGARTGKSRSLSFGLALEAAARIDRLEDEVQMLRAFIAGKVHSLLPADDSLLSVHEPGTDADYRAQRHKAIDDRKHNQPDPLDPEDVPR